MLIQEREIRGSERNKEPYIEIGGTQKFQKFHFVKIETQQGRWITLQPQNNLERKIKELNPKNIYVSVNQFLKFKEHNKTYSYQNIPIKKYSLIDIDGQEFNNKEECFDYFKGIFQFLKDNSIQIEKIVCTNTIVGGFHILISPCSYMDFFALYKNHTQRFLKIDARVLNDDRRVRRLENTFNGNKGCYSFEIPKDLNISEINKINNLAYISPLFPNAVMANDSIRFDTLGMPYEDMDKKFRQMLLESCIAKGSQPFPLQNIEADDNVAVEKQPILTIKTKRNAQIKSNGFPQHFLVREMSSSIMGVKDLYCPVLKLKSKPSKRFIKNLQKYHIGDLYCFKGHLGHYLISPKAHQFRRLEKVYRKMKVWTSLSELQKFHTNWIYISNIFDLEQRKYLKTFNFIECYEKDANGDYSKAHLFWLQKYYKKYYPNQIGTEIPKIYIAEFTN